MVQRFHPGLLRGRRWAIRGLFSKRSLQKRNVSVYLVAEVPSPGFIAFCITMLVVSNALHLGVMEGNMPSACMYAHGNMTG